MSVKPMQTPMTAKQLWDAANPLYPHFMAWLKAKGFNPQDLGNKPRKQKASQYLRLMNVRKAA